MVLILVIVLQMALIRAQTKIPVEAVVVFFVGEEVFLLDVNYI